MITIKKFFSIIYVASIIFSVFSIVSYEQEKKRLLDEDPNFFLAGWTQDPRSELIKGLNKQRIGSMSIAAFSNFVLIYIYYKIYTENLA